MARVMEAGVGHPVGVFGLTDWLVIRPVVTSSASRFGVMSVCSGVGPAPEIPGIVEIKVFPSITQKTGLFPWIWGEPVRNAI
jgi:hypothetical protein